MASPILDSSGIPLPSRNNVVPMRPNFMMDAMANIMSGRGTSIDKRTANFYYMVPIDPQQAEIAYRTDWLMRKIIDIPPLDMTRAWRAWQTDKNNIEALEKEERRLQVKAKVKRALILARLWGGGGIVIGNGDADTMQPLKPGTGKGSLRYLNVYSRYQLTTGAEITDPESPWCGQPEKFTLTTTGRQIDLHPSRVVAFVGQKLPEGSLVMASDWFWGDPIMQSINDAVENAGTAQGGFASLIDEASVDVLKVPGLTERAATEEYETSMLRRLSAAGMGKSTWRKLLIDGDEEWDQHQVTWAGIPDVMISFLQIVAGAADIPITRLLGQSPKGLQSTGDGEERDYKDMIAARQEEMVQPALDRIDELLIPSALGSTPSDIWWQFNSLDRMSPKDAAEVEYKRATTVKAYVDAGLFPEDALAAMAKNAVIESGQWPGSEAAFEAAKLDAPFEQEPDPNELLTAEEIAAQQAKGGGPVSTGAKMPQRRAANDAWFFADAAAKPLYVQRKLLNAADLIAWAKAQGFTSTLPAGDMHVTVLYSRQAVDPMKMGETWTSEADGGLTVKPGGPRAVEKLGEDAVVLLFASWSLVSRHNEMVEAGASHDYAEYQPHVTISYEIPEGMDLAAIKPFTGELRFGPEIFEPLDLDWKAKVTEE